MMLGAFVIGYVGATLYERYRHKATQVAVDNDIDLLKKEIQDLKEENEQQNRKLSYRKDRMDQEYPKLILTVLDMQIQRVKMISKK